MPWKIKIVLKARAGQTQYNQGVPNEVVGECTFKLKATFNLNKSVIFSKNFLSINKKIYITVITYGLLHLEASDFFFN